MTFQKNSSLFDPDFDEKVDTDTSDETVSALEMSPIKVLGLGALISVLVFCTIGFFVLLFVLF